MKRVSMIVSILVLAFVCVSYAGSNPDAKVAIHVRVHDAKAGCSVSIADCEDIVYTVAGSDIDAFPVFFNLTEYAGCSYSLTWPEWTYSATFTSCSDLVIGGITLPGSAQYAAHSWRECQTGVCIPGFVWLYADGPGTICAIEPEAAGLSLSVLDCSEGLDSPIENFCAGVYGAPGDDPCGERDGGGQEGAGESGGIRGYYKP
jgi:hypothetical protein